MSAEVDLVVLGAGPGGYVAAVRAAQLGLTVAIVEERYWGGVCLNVGCVPAKSLLRNAEIARLVTAQKELFGLAGDITADYAAAYARSRKVSSDRVKGIHYLMRKNRITEFEGRGRFTGPRAMSVTAADGSVSEIRFGKAIIATGSTVRMLPGVETSANVLTYETMILASDVPRRVVVIGAGAIGIEFAYLLRSYGAEVTVVEYLDRVLPLEDADVSAELEKHLRSLGVEVLTSTRVDGVTDRGDDVEVVCTVDGEERTLVAERVLVSVGFAPRIDGYGLESTGVEVTDRGAIAVDGYLRTSVDGIYAIGDVTAKLALAHVAEAQGMVAAEHAAGAQTHPIDDYRFMPRATFCQPQVASFGLTEAQARAEGRGIRVSTFPFVANAKAHALGDASGFVKLIADDEHGELIGAHLIGHDVSELLPQLTLAHRFELTAEDLTLNVHTHPTMSEAMQEAFHGLVGAPINM
ncbi:dihydrolipoyl dehydrogenase [Microbacterium sp. VKM Ac-2923]|uniref:dihydrolipoyl dehydrogenase n=1 Tax=Microbacterium sp. VKM Ac-2923 TaxID=2929476 RepID=UPI001FB56D4B|nr:dihydrolipoyl dehydrogenase [Microbacterium sp. VKM Ac-2923]MCJ1707799.1 dihydrolipoyl dehydrogenase [Microbacterium sp. VKM Ac-2923]